MRLEGQSSAALIYGLTPPKRGRFEFGHTVVRFPSPLRLAWSEAKVGEPTAVKVYPNMRRAREAELKALGARSLVSAHRKTSWRGEGREFESLREYVRGDELRHISWTATARRGKLTTRQYQIERDQTILIVTRCWSFDDCADRAGNKTGFCRTCGAGIDVRSCQGRRQCRSDGLWAADSELFATRSRPRSHRCSARGALFRRAGNDRALLRAGAGVCGCK